jgi:prepilin-type N-terminal cleavage/methylation domain-containing protein
MICREDKKSNQSGFTLIEVLISVLILSMVVASASTAFVFATKSNRDNEVKMQAVNLANEQIEYIRSLAFAQVGKKGGDPDGEIPAADDFKTLDGRKYRIHTKINWSTGIDYKIVKVTVTPDGMERLNQTIETCVAKQAAETVNDGANVIVHFTRAWKDNVSDNVPIPDVPVKLTGSKAVRFVPSSSEGTSIFSNLEPGNYALEVTVPDGMMLMPGESENWQTGYLGKLKQSVNDIQMEKPCSVKLTLMGLDDNPISVPEDADIKINFIDINGKSMPAEFKGSKLENGTLPAINHFWPVGKGFAGNYMIESINIKGLNCYGQKKPENPDHKSGDYSDEGKTFTFDGPGTCKNITCYFGKGFVPPKESKTPGWVPNNWGGIASGTHITDDEGTFVTPNLNLSLSINAASGCGYNFTAQKLFFLNEGTVNNAGLIINSNVRMTLHARYVDFRGWVDFNGGNYNQGKIYLTTQSNGNCNIKPIKAENGVEYGVLHVEKYIKAGGVTVLGSGNYYFTNGMRLPDDAGKLIPITLKNAVDLE